MGNTEQTVNLIVIINVKTIFAIEMEVVFHVIMTMYMDRHVASIARIAY